MPLNRLEGLDTRLADAVKLVLNEEEKKNRDYKRSKDVRSRSWSGILDSDQ